MAKIKYKVDGKGVLTVQADVQVGQSLQRIFVQGAAVDNQKDPNHKAWAQLTWDLFGEKERVQNGASKPKGGM